MMVKYGHQPTSGFSERTSLKKIKQRETEQDIECAPLVSTHVPVVLLVDTHACTHAPLCLCARVRTYICTTHAIHTGHTVNKQANNK